MGPSSWCWIALQGFTGRSQSALGCTASWVHLGSDFAWGFILNLLNLLNLLFLDPWLFEYLFFWTASESAFVTFVIFLLTLDSWCQRMCEPKAMGVRVVVVAPAISCDWARDMLLAWRFMNGDLERYLCSAMPYSTCAAVQVFLFVLCFFVALHSNSEVPSSFDDHER